MRSIISHRHRQLSAPCDVDEPLRPGFFQRGLHPKPCRDECLYARVFMLQQILQALVALGQRVGQLARRGAGLHRAGNTEGAKHGSELRIGHEVGFVVHPRSGEQIVLYRLRLYQVRDEPVFVQLQRRFGEHPQGQVDQPEFRLREAPCHHHVEDVIGQVHVVDAVAAIGIQFVYAEIGAAFALGVQHLGAFDADTIGFGQRLEAGALLHTVNGSGHAERIEQRLRADAQTPRQDRPVEHHVVCQHSGVGPVVLGQKLLDRTVGSTEPTSFFCVDLDPHADDLEAGVTDVFFRGDLRQGEVLVVVGFRVNRNNIHHTSP